MSAAVTAPPDALVDELLRGAVDLHVHTGPSIMIRKLDHLDQIRHADAAGMRAILLKDHFYSNTPMMEILTRHHKPKVKLLSGVPLNNAVGGLNPYAVEHGLMLGARLVWMPTLSAYNHMRSAFRYDLAGRLDMLPPLELSAVSDRGVLQDDVKRILDLIAQYDAVLCGGHLHISEMYPLFEEAKARGVKRLLISHPTFWVDGNLDDLRDLARMGVYMEHCACLHIDCVDRKFTGEDLRAYADAAGIERTILCSDLGQPQNPHPVEGFRAVIKLCLEVGFTPDEVRKMVSGNACRLMGIDPAGDA